MTLLRPKEIRDQHPKIKRTYTDNDIGYLLSLGLVRGKKLKRGCLVALEDVEKVLLYRDAVLKGG